MSQLLIDYKLLKLLMKKNNKLKKFKKVLVAKINNHLKSSK